MKVWFSLFVVITGCLIVSDWENREPMLPVERQILDSDVQEVTYKLWNLTLGGSNRVYGSRGHTLYRIDRNGEQATPIFHFDQSISGIHERQNGLLLVATDGGRWDSSKPCRIYISNDGGKHFHQTHILPHSVALWWSISSDQSGNIYLGEYGPQQQGMSKQVWRSSDDGESWLVVFTAEDKDKVHIHRVAVDPFTQNVWLTIGDGDNRQMWRSKDQGRHWSRGKKDQATAVAFSANSIFWGKDEKGAPGILHFDRETQQFSTIFNPQSYGNYGGSIYDMAIAEDGNLYVPFMKYADQDHIASLWRGKDDQWQPILLLKSQRGQGSAVETIAGPDRDGWIYITGYKIDTN